jgi:hypothetical protein
MERTQFKWTITLVHTLYKGNNNEGMRMMSVMRSEQWTDAHLAANEVLAQLLNQLRDLGYNPSQHISYDRETNHVVVESELLNQHPELKPVYDAYVAACERRYQALQAIQAMPKQKLKM